MRSLAVVGTIVLGLVSAPLVRGEETPVATATAAPTPPPSTLDNTITAGESDDVPPARDLVKWNHYEGKFFSIRVGGGFLYEGAAYAQDDESKEQFALHPEGKVRDARFSLKGRLKFKREVTWTSGIMYDGPSDSFLVRETGIMVAVPEISGHIFVGRTKEGFSLNKVMVGYAGWTMERSTVNDAMIPILADGIKYLGYLPKARVLWNLGAYVDWLSRGQSFSSYEQQFVGRVAWVPMESEEKGTLLHLGMSARYGNPTDGTLKLRSRPEAFTAPYFLDTTSYSVDHTKMLGFEGYYRPGPFLFGTEYFVQKWDSPATGNPVFHGGEAVVTWLPTGETRGYNTRGGFFKQISPLRPVFKGGPGAWELVARVSYIDLDDGPVHGGRFWRFTPMVNWHLSDNVRLEMTYGYGGLDRFDRVGHTQFFQARLQLQL